MTRNVALLEEEQPELRDELSVFHNKAYLMREYMALKEYEKAFANCRYLLDHGEQWQEACKVYAFNYIQRFYGAMELAAVKRFWFSRSEIYDKLVKGVRDNYSGSREAALIGLYYQMLFDYREDRFLKELAAVGQLTENLPPAAISESRRGEAAIYGRGALAVYYRGERETARQWAEEALALDPEGNQEMLKAVIEGTVIAPDAIGSHILQKEYELAYALIAGQLDQGSLDHTLLEALLIVAEKAPPDLAGEARERFAAAMELLDEAIALTDIINTEYTAHLGGQPYPVSTRGAAPPDLLALRRLVMPIYAKKGLLARRQ